MTISTRQYVATILVLLAAFALIAFKAPKADATGALSTNLGYVSTSTALTSITTSVRIAATTTNPLDPTNSYSRVYTTICNTAANPVYLRLDGDKKVDTGGAVTGYTAAIAAAAGYSTCYEITDRNMYNGSIQASSTNQTATSISVAQYVQ